MFSPFTSRASAAESEAGMETEAAPKKRRLTAFGKKARRERIFARLREGWAYDEIARQEGLTAARVRQIVAEVLHRRQIDDNTAHALLQLARLGPAVQLVGEAVARGDVQAVWQLSPSTGRFGQCKSSYPTWLRQEPAGRTQPILHRLV